MIEFRGAQVVVTGASAGIGREFAVQLHQAGAELWLIARRESLLHELSSELNAKRAGSVKYEVVDLANGVELRALAQRLNSAKVDILINNAGRGSFGQFETLDLEKEEELVHLNVLAPLRLTHAVLPQMKARRSGAVVMLASIAGLQPLPYMATYGATKAFDLSFGIALAEELRGSGVRVLSVAPGPVATEFGGVARVPGEFTNIGRDSAQQVVSESLNALQKNKAWMVPCLQGQLLSWPSRLLPWRWTTYLTERSLRGSLRAKQAMGEKHEG